MGEFEKKSRGRDPRGNYRAEQSSRASQRPVSADRYDRDRSYSDRYEDDYSDI